MSLSDNVGAVDGDWASWAMPSPSLVAVVDGQVWCMTLGCYTGHWPLVIVDIVAVALSLNVQALFGLVSAAAAADRSKKDG